MDQYHFQTDEGTKEYCSLILDYMVAKMNIPREVALNKMNAAWKGKAIMGKYDIIYHREVEYWAEMLGREGNPYQR